MIFSHLTRPTRSGRGPGSLPLMVARISNSITHEDGHNPPKRLISEVKAFRLFPSPPRPGHFCFTGRCQHFLNLHLFYLGFLGFTSSPVLPKTCSTIANTQTMPPSSSLPQKRDPPLGSFLPSPYVHFQPTFQEAQRFKRRSPFLHRQGLNSYSGQLMWNLAGLQGPMNKCLSHECKWPLDRQAHT